MIVLRDQKEWIPDRVGDDMKNADDMISNNPRCVVLLTPVPMNSGRGL